MALVVVSGILGLLLLLAYSMLSLTRIASAGLSAAAGEAAARNASESGIEYAAALLPLSSAAEADRLAATRRLRGGGVRFRLAVSWPGGKLPVNAGSLASPDHANAALPFHNAVAHALNNLGAMLLDPNPAIGRVTRRGGKDTNGDDLPDLLGEELAFSRLGTDLLSSRPPGGYRDLGAIRSLLLAKGYSRDECDRILPYLSAGPYETLPGGGRRRLSDSADAFPYAPLELAVAAKPVLASLWMHLGTARPDLPGETGAWLTPCRRTGAASVSFGATWPDTVGLVLYQDEAEALADLAETFRREHPLSWKGLLKELFDKAPVVFQKDHANLAAFPQAATSWARAKAIFAFHTAAIDPLPPASPSIAFTWGIDADGAAGGTQPFAPGLRNTELGRIPYPDAAGKWTYGPMSPYSYERGSRYHPVAPLGMTLAPPVWAEVRSDGEAAQRGGRVLRATDGLFRSAERLELSSQEDFDALSSAANLAARGILLKDLPDPVERRDVHSDSAVVPRFPYAHLSSWPRWSARSLPPAWRTPPSRAWGSISLAPRDFGPREAALYWPFLENSLPDPDSRSEPLPPAAQHEILPAGSFDDFVTAAGHLTGTLPGFPPPFKRSGFVIDELSAECWLFPAYLRNAGLSLQYDWGGIGDPYETLSLDLNASRTISGNRLGTQLTASLYWSTTLDDPRFPWGPLCLLDPSGRDPFLPDVDPVTGKVQTGPLHAALTLKRVSSVTHLVLYVNGEERARTELPAELFEWPAPHTLYVRCADKLRLYDRCLTPGDVRSRWEDGRFVNTGLFRSPGYLLGRGSTVLQAQWTAITTPETESRTPLTAKIIPLDGLGNDLPGGKDLGPPAGPREVELAASGFRYEVLFDMPIAAGGALHETPHFESAWFILRRRGISPFFSRWNPDPLR